MKLITYSNCIDITEIIKKCPQTDGEYCLMLVINAEDKESLYKYLDVVKKTIEITE